MWVVDFWDQGGLPNWFAGVLQRWLSVFHVRHRPELLGYFRELERRGLVTLSIEPLYRRYAYLAQAYQDRVKNVTAIHLEMARKLRQKFEEGRAVSQRKQLCRI